MNLYEQIETAKVFGRGQHIEEEGKFRVRFLGFKVFESENDKGLVWLTEFVILESSGATPVGVTRSWVQLPEVNQKTAPGNIKEFFQQLLGKDEPTAVEVQAAEDGKYNGWTIDLKIYYKKTKAGRDFYGHKWVGPAIPCETPTISATPAAPKPLTKDAWLLGEGPGTIHPQNPTYEYSPDNIDWGCRPRTP